MLPRQSEKKTQQCSALSAATHERCQRFTADKTAPILCYHHRKMKDVEIAAEAAADCQCAYVDSVGKQCVKNSNRPDGDNTRCCQHKRKAGFEPCGYLGCRRWHRKNTMTPYCVNHAVLTQSYKARTKADLDKERLAQIKALQTEIALLRSSAGTDTGVSREADACPASS